MKSHKNPPLDPNSTANKDAVAEQIVDNLPKITPPSSATEPKSSAQEAVELELQQSPFAQTLQLCQNPALCATELSQKASEQGLHFTEERGGFICTWIINSTDDAIATLFQSQEITALGSWGFMHHQRVSDAEKCLEISAQMEGVTEAIRDGNVTSAAVW